MSSFYGMVEGASATAASRRGFKDIKSSAQSWNGSVITRLYYNDDGVLQVNIQLADDSSFYGQSYFTGSFQELKEKLSRR